MASKKTGPTKIEKLEKIHMHGPALCHEIARVQGHNDAILLSFSGGKDSLCAWLAMRDHFGEVVPYYLYMVPGLEFIENWMARCEKFMGVKIVQLPHYHLYAMLNAYIYQPPERVETIYACNWPKFEFEDVRRIVCEDRGLPPDTYYGTGIRAPDGPLRMVTLIQNGPITHNQNKFHPVWNWTKARLMKELTENKIPLPIDYKLFSRSWDGIDLRFCYRLKQYFPDDYRRILDWFPLAELEFSRYEFYLRKKKVDDLRRRNATEEEITNQIMQMKNDFPIKYEEAN